MIAPLQRTRRSLAVRLALIAAIALPSSGEIAGQITLAGDPIWEVLAERPSGGRAIHAGPSLVVRFDKRVFDERVNQAPQDHDLPSSTVVL